jgi:pyruvate formate lyase activating enzyme
VLILRGSLPGGLTTDEGGRLQAILGTIRRLHQMGFWLEIVRLVISGFNDPDDELQRLTEFIASVSADIPWHGDGVSQRLQYDRPGQHQCGETLVRAAAIGSSSGLRYVYAGNLPGQVGDSENTRTLSQLPADAD